MKTCEGCGVPIKPGRALTCGAKACRNRMRARKMREFLAAYKAEHGKPYTKRNEVAIEKRRVLDREAHRAKGRTGPPCAACGEPTVNRYSAYCSRLCVMYDRHGPVFCKLPRDHPVSIGIKQLTAKPSTPKRHPPARECPGCACTFSPISQVQMICCSRPCAKRLGRRKRRAREYDAVGMWVWSDFMRIAAKFGYCCAYCGEKPDGQLDPDHVVPLSRGGDNSATNLLPACRPCNQDKRNLLLHEWELDRVRLSKPPRVTSWAPEDKRYRHLTQAMLTHAA